LVETESKQHNFPRSKCLKSNNRQDAGKRFETTVNFDWRVRLAPQEYRLDPIQKAFH